MGNELVIDGGMLVEAGNGMKNAAAEFSAPQQSLSACGATAVAQSARDSERVAALAMLHLGGETHDAATTLTSVGALFESVDTTLGVEVAR
ncbi:hypothetical protein [Demequina sediminicola]|uniref:hypothetical protein n=1 Tax=Demequina sediminicola TaxID=1095026 RepID=UPI0007848DDD|nr:hypothetical protein [Demequina sediminicola]